MDAVSVDKDLYLNTHGEWWWNWKAVVRAVREVGVVRVVVVAVVVGNWAGEVWREVLEKRAQRYLDAGEEDGWLFILSLECSTFNKSAGWQAILM